MPASPAPLPSSHLHQPPQRFTSPPFRFTKRWLAFWNGHYIVVENWWDLLLRGGEELFINGVSVYKNNGWSQASQDLHSDIEFEGKTYHVRVHVGSVDWGITVGCQIFIDEVLIGGDMSKKFIT